MDEPAHQPRRDKSGLPPPKCKAMLLCETAITDASTQKTSLINLFQSFVLPKFPGWTHFAVAYVHLSSGLGLYQIRTEVHDLEQDTILLHSPFMQVEFTTRLMLVKMMIGIPPLKLPHPGIYDLVLMANGDEIDRMKFGAVLTGQEPITPPLEAP